MLIKNNTFDFKIRTKYSHEKIYLPILLFTVFKRLQFSNLLRNYRNNFRQWTKQWFYRQCDRFIFNNAQQRSSRASYINHQPPRVTRHQSSLETTLSLCRRMHDSRPATTQQALRVASFIPKSNQVTWLARTCASWTHRWPQVLWKRASTLEAESLLHESRDICERAALMQAEAMKLHDDIKTAQVWTCVWLFFRACMFVCVRTCVCDCVWLCALVFSFSHCKQLYI